MSKFLDRIVWISQNGIPILQIPNEIKWFIQRGRRGYSDRDVWNLDGYLSMILSRALLRLADTTHGNPCRIASISGNGDDCKYCDCASKWDKELRENAEKFRLLHEDNWETSEELKQLDDARKEALEWLAKWYGSLWD